MDTGGILLYYAIMLLVPFLLGCALFAMTDARASIGAGALTGADSREGRGIAERWNAGMLLAYGGFEVVALFGTLMRASLRRISIVYAILLLLFLLAGIAAFLIRRSGADAARERSPRIGSGYARAARNRAGSGNRGARHGAGADLERSPRIGIYEAALAALVALGVIYQMWFVCTHLHIDDDDAFYVGWAVTAYSTNTVAEFHPYTGEPAALSDFSDYATALYPVLSAALSIVTGLHPAALMRSVMPAVHILWCYVAYGMVGRRLFSSKRQRLEFLLIVVAAHLFGGYSGLAAPYFLLVRGWQGKAVVAAVFVPLFWGLWLRVRRDPRDAGTWCMLAASVWASACFSLMAVFLGGAIFLVCGIWQLFRERDMGTVLRLYACCLPYLALGIFQIYLDRL